MTLDRIDLEIIAALQKNARLSNKELAARAGLAPSSCHARVRALTRAGVLAGYHAQVTTGALGVTLEALVAVRMVKHSQGAFRALYDHMQSLEEVLAIYHVSGVNDLQVHVAVRDIRHLRDLIVERFANRPEVDHCETAVIYDLFQKYALPCYLPAPKPPGAGKGESRSNAPRRRRGGTRR
jgi:DNA-binding Lrp family transcriptional regulator